MKSNNSLASDLKKVKGLGSAKEGTHHWLMQRLTAIALIPLALWFTSLVIKLCIYKENDLYLLLESPVNIILLMVFLPLCLYHGMLGLRVIIEDYVHKEGLKFLMILGIGFIVIITIIAVICALLTYYFAFLN